MSSWDDFLRRAQPAEHAVQTYREPDALADAVAEYLAGGFEVGERAVVVATPAHARLVAQRLDARGWPQHTLRERRLLVSADADATLAALMEDGSPSAAAFERVVGGLLDRAAAPLFQRRLRAYGEMVDLLHRRGRTDAALALEELWTKLARTRTFSLLCAYHLDVLDPADQNGALPAVCAAHTHVLPPAQPGLLARAVDRALDEVLGPEAAGRVYVLVADRIREGRTPAPQLALAWICENMPVLAGRVLASARAHHRAASAGA